jgi:RND family efflux transporter MFP subunit
LAFLPCACSKAPPAVETPPAALVEVVQAKKETLDEWIEFPGVTQPLPNHDARVTAAVEGTVVLVAASSGPAVSEGQWVEAGQVIVRLDDRIARETLAKAIAGPKDLEAQKKQAESAVALARENLKRLQKLARGTGSTETPLISAAELEKAQTALDAAVSQLQSVEAKQAGGQADVQAIQNQLGLYTLRAPIAGWLGTVQVVPGQTIPIGTSVAEVLDLKDIDVLCFVPPSRIGRIALGQTARVAPSDAPGSPPTGPEGKVVYVSLQARPETGSFEVKVRFPNQELKLPANEVVDVVIQTTPPKERLVIPVDAVMEDQEPPSVAVVPSLKAEKDEKVGKVRMLRVSLGVRNRQRRLVEVLALEDPEKKEPVPSLQESWFVTAGGHGLEDGDEVRVKEEHAEAEKGEKGEKADKPEKTDKPEKPEK